MKERELTRLDRKALRKKKKRGGYGEGALKVRKKNVGKRERRCDNREEKKHKSSREKRRRWGQKIRQKKKQKTHHSERQIKRGSPARRCQVLTIE